MPAVGDNNAFFRPGTRKTLQDVGKPLEAQDESRKAVVEALRLGDDAVLFVGRNRLDVMIEVGYLYFVGIVGGARKCSREKPRKNMKPQINYFSSPGMGGC